MIQKHQGNIVFVEIYMKVIISMDLSSLIGRAKKRREKRMLDMI